MVESEAEEKSEITREELENVLRAWGDGSMSNKEIHSWAETNFYPLTQKLAPGCQRHTEFAMFIIQNEFDSSEPMLTSAKGAEDAIKFLNTSVADFGNQMRRFLENCFDPINEAEFDKTLDRLRRISSAS